MPLCLIMFNNIFVRKLKLEDIQYAFGVIVIGVTFPPASCLDIKYVLHHRDLVVIIAALEYNQWFTKLSIKDYKLVCLTKHNILKY